jgi:hypothetical protein
MAMIGSTILTNAGASALTQASISNPVDISSMYFVVSNQVITLDPTLTTLTGWITKPVSSIVIINDDAIQISCIVEPNESVSSMMVVGVFLPDGTLFALSQPANPIPPLMRQVLNIQLVYSSITQLTQFNFIPTDVNNQNLMMLNIQASMANQLWSLSNHNNKYDVLFRSYYDYKASNVNFSDIYIEPVYGDDLFSVTGLVPSLPLHNIDYAIERNKDKRFVRLNLYDNFSYYLSNSHTIYDMNLTFKAYNPIEYSGFSTTTGNWKVLPRTYQSFSDVENAMLNIGDLVPYLTDPIQQENNLGITFETGPTRSGYWIAELFIGDLVSGNFNLDINTSDGISLYTTTLLPNTTAELLFQSDNFTSASNSGTINETLDISSNDTYLFAVLNTTSDTGTQFSITDNTTTVNDLLNVVIVPTQVSGLLSCIYLNGNCNLVFEDVSIDLSQVTESNYSMFKANPSSNSRIIFINSTIHLSSGISLVTNRWTDVLGKLHAGGKVEIEFINSTIYTNSGNIFTGDQPAATPNVYLDSLSSSI